MKVRNGFVSNSSSSSFIFLGIKMEHETPEEIEVFVEENDLDILEQYTEDSGDGNIIGEIVLRKGMEEEYKEEIDILKIIEDFRLKLDSLGLPDTIKFFAGVGV